MGKENNKLNFISSAIVILLAVVLFGTLATMSAEKAQDLRTNINTTLSALSIATVSANVSLGHTGEGVTSMVVTRNNDTWLVFDGVNDHINITDYSYKTISFHFKNATGPNSGAWQHIVNTSNILYQNGTEVSSVLDYPVTLNGTVWIIGMSNETEFFNGSIDSIKFYNDTINESIVDEVYTTGRLS